MYVLVLPVSGGGFPAQLAILQHLCESDFVPDLTLASSGGNVSAYVAAAAQWKWAGIERIARELNQELFATPWATISAIAFAVGYFKGDIYNKGNGVSDFLHRHFTPESITKYEIWTGTYNKNQHKARLFCNRGSDTTIMNVSHIDQDLTQSMDPIFANGDIQLIAQAGIASASIPGQVPAEVIQKESYIDGGVAGASPLTIMQEPILNYVQTKSTGLHLTYVNSIDLSDTNSLPCNNVIDTWTQAAQDVIRSQTVNDRLSGYELLRCQFGMMNKSEFECTYENMNRIRQIQRKIKFSMVEIYPTNSVSVNLTKFSGQDVVTAMKQSYGKCRCRFWWISPMEISSIPEPVFNSPDVNHEVCALLHQCDTLSDPSDNESIVL